MCVSSVPPCTLKEELKKANRLAVQDIWTFHHGSVDFYNYYYTGLNTTTTIIIIIIAIKSMRMGLAEHVERMGDMRNI
jgi:hypothetical protein